MQHVDNSGEDLESKALSWCTQFPGVQESEEEETHV